MRIKLTYTFLGLFMASFLLAQPAAPSGFSASGYDSHVELRWQPNTESNISYYRIYRADGEGQPFQTIKNVSANQRWAY
jgi:fibronectin type 3 domain-containing protein